MTHDKEIQELVEALKNVEYYIPYLHETQIGIVAKKANEASAVIDQLNKGFYALLAENKRYREALEFYANRESYVHRSLSEIWTEGRTAVGKDRGLTAYKALNPSEEK